MGGRWEEPSWDNRDLAHLRFIFPSARSVRLRDAPHTPQTFLPVLFLAVSLVPRTVPGTQEALSERLWNERTDREPGSVRRVRLEVAKWLRAGPGTCPASSPHCLLPHPSCVFFLPAWHCVSHPACFLFPAVSVHV